MDLPDVQRGMSILADHIQRINSSVRQVRVRPGVGYTVRETPGGTSLLINAGMLGGGGNASTVPCPFECTAASEGSTLKVQVGWGLIWQKLPTGMYPTNDPPLKMTVTQTCFIYSRITFDTNTLIPTDVSFSVETEIQQNTSSTQYNLIAVVTVNTDADPNVITKIDNVCQQPFPSPCALASA